ncbi:6777_t:CDS:1, partial [Cetraspora pellucida]
MLVNNIADNIKSNEINLNDAMNDNKINVNEYFKEVYSGAMEVEELFMNIKVVTLKKEDSFSNFDDAKQYVLCYAEFKKFKIRLSHNTIVETE